MGDREIGTVSNRVVVRLTYTSTLEKGADLTQLAFALSGPTPSLHGQCRNARGEERTVGLNPD